MRMVTSGLFREVLIRPAALDGADKLCVVSGFATAGMVEHHLERLRELHNRGDIGIMPEINLLVGMAMSGLETVQHRAFCSLVEKFDAFSCYYLVEGDPCHAKVYVWERAGVPAKAFLGSANYTRTGFGTAQREAVATVDPGAAQEYCTKLWEDAVCCSEADTTGQVPLIRGHDQLTDENYVRLPLVIERGEHAGQTHQRAGLNWGQRPGRNPDQAYVPIPKRVRERKFFPPIEERFTTLTDDGHSLILVVAQQFGKALHTTMDNSELGRYLRARLGVPSGEYVTRDHLDAYGRTTVDFYKIDPETYYMDFRPNAKPGRDVDVRQE